MAEKKNGPYFRFRLRFRIEQIGMLRSLEDQPKRVFLEWQGRKLAFMAVHGETFGKTDTFELSAGGYSTSEEARLAADQLRLALLTVGMVVGQGLGVAAPRTLASSIERPEMSAKFDCEDKPLDVPAQMVSSRSDFVIIEQPAEDTDYVNFEAGGMILNETVSPTGLFSVCDEVMSATSYFNAHQRMVLELFNAAYFENSLEARFLTWMLAMEAVLETRPRPPRIVDVVANMRELLAQCRQHLTADGGLSDDERISLDGLKTTLKHAENESISQGMRRIAREAAGQAMFHERSAESFMKYCYDVRSMLVHSGTVGKYEQDFGKIVTEFEVLARMIVMRYLKVGPLQFPQPEISFFSMDNVSLGFS